MTSYYCKFVIDVKACLSEWLLPFISELWRQLWLGVIYRASLLDCYSDIRIYRFTNTDGEMVRYYLTIIFQVFIIIFSPKVFPSLIFTWWKFLKPQVWRSVLPCPPSSSELQKFWVSTCIYNESHLILSLANVISCLIWSHLKRPIY